MASQDVVYFGLVGPEWRLQLNQCAIPSAPTLQEIASLTMLCAMSVGVPGSGVQAYFDRARIHH